MQRRRTQRAPSLATNERVPPYLLGMSDALDHILHAEDPARAARALRARVNAQRRAHVAAYLGLQEAA